MTTIDKGEWLARQLDSIGPHPARYSPEVLAAIKRRGLETMGH